MSVPPERPVQKTTTQARSGVTGHNVRYVLVIGLGAAIIAMALAWYFVS